MNDAVFAIFGEQVVASLATLNPDGTPRATPLHTVTDGQAVYWFSPATAVHSHNIAQDNRVSLCLASPDESHGLRGVYIAGRAELVADADRRRIVELYTARTGGFPAQFADWRAYALPVGKLDKQKSTGNCWYFYS